MEMTDFLEICESYLSDNLFRICVRICSGFEGGGHRGVVVTFPMCSICRGISSTSHLYHDHSNGTHVKVMMIDSIPFAGQN